MSPLEFAMPGCNRQTCPGMRRRVDADAGTSEAWVPPAAASSASVQHLVGRDGERRRPNDHVVSRTTDAVRSEEHTSELQSLMRISYAVFCLKKKNIYEQENTIQI